jgi:hypothetical protein
MTNNKQQTAVEWLVEQLSTQFTYGQKIQFERLFEMAKERDKEQAKEMEKEQKIMDYEMGYINGGNQKKITGEQYYEQTYGGCDK